MIYRCAQCFRPFPDGIFYEFEGYKYCEHDFHVLFAPCCGKCGKLCPKKFTYRSINIAVLCPGLIERDVTYICRYIKLSFIAGEFVIGRVIKAMNSNWHPQCFRCEECNGELADAGFIKSQGRALCHTCNARVKAGVLGKHICHQCQ